MKSIFLFLLALLLVLSATSFVLSPRHPSSSSSTTSILSLNAKKKPTKKNKSPGGGGGFGGAAMEDCPCGSLETYSACCGKVHKDVNAYKSATAEQVVRARYAAYSKKQADFLMASTHPLNSAFDPDLKQWKETIKTNMYDNFDLPKCIIVEESYLEDDSDGEKAEVTFIAEMILKESGEKTSFMETSQFERAKTHGGWLYLNGTIEAVPDELMENLETK